MLSTYEPDYHVPEDPGDPLPPARRDKRFVTPLEAAIIVMLVVVALISAFPLRAHFSDPTAYAHTVERLDDKRNVVLGLTAAATGASAAITAIPDDTGTPIAERLMDLSGDLAIVLIAIYIEKYLLTIFGFTAFGILIPVACALLVAVVLTRRRSQIWVTLGGVATKLILMGIVLVITVPASVAVTDMIERTYDLSISTEEISEEVAAGEDSAGEAGDAEEATGNPFVDAWNFLSSVPELLGNAASDLTDELLNSVSDLIDGFAVLILTTCVVPIGVLAFFLWAANLVTGIDVSGAMRMLKPRTVDNVRNDVRHLRSRASKGKR
ncbi:hypothetical protein [uncultured Enorma sp.]|uniref:hypothetical protein n=1 Tax=uncultured Enorma sp. TaxID=1714346 RepID=UPI0028063B44|nr:hypothetical protein [uncultured Enorma sp.]